MEAHEQRVHELLVAVPQGGALDPARVNDLFVLAAGDAELQRARDRHGMLSIAVLVFLVGKIHVAEQALLQVGREMPVLNELLEHR